MKQFISYTLAISVALACNKNEVSDPAFFAAGQEVTISASYEVLSDTRVTGTLDGTTGAVNFVWKDGDIIKVTVSTSDGDKSSIFTLKSGGNATTATFTWMMPAAGSSFSLQYPVSDIDLSFQTYAANKVPEEKLQFKATNCMLAGTNNLLPQQAVLRLNLWGDDVTVGKIEVTDISTSSTYVLNCDTGISIGASAGDSTPFLMVMPEGSYMFRAEVYDNSSTPKSLGTFQTNLANAFNTVKVLNMPPRELHTDL